MPGKMPYAKYDLEKYFERYPDVPKEVIIKEDILRLGVHFTDAALEESSKFTTKSYYLFSYDQTDVEEMKRQEFLKAPEEFKFKDGPYHLQPSNNKTCIEK